MGFRPQSFDNTVNLKVHDIFNISISWYISTKILTYLTDINPTRMHIYTFCKKLFLYIEVGEEGLRSILNFWLFQLQENVSYQDFLSEWKNIVPGQSLLHFEILKIQYRITYRILKISTSPKIMENTVFRFSYVDIFTSES